MKKLIFILISLIFSYISFAQEGERQLSNYEKYVLAKEKAMETDTLYKTDTVYVDAKGEKAEYDDLYYIPSKDDIKRKKEMLRLEKKQIQMEQNAAYYDAYEEVYEDLYYTSLINRFSYGYSFGYYSPYWRYSYGWYDPFYYDPWYWGSGWSFSFSWGYPYYGYPYYGYSPYYYRPYYSYSYYSPYYNHNHYYGNSFKNGKYIPYDYARREKSAYSTLQSTKSFSKPAPVTLNKTVQVDRRSGQVLNTQIEGRRISPSTSSVSRTQETNKVIQQERGVSTTRPDQKPTYNKSERTYTPTYSAPRMSSRPEFNNTNTTRSTSATQNRSTVNASSRTQTQTRTTVSTPARTQTQTRSTYTAPSRSSVSTPSRSTSSYSTPSRSTSSYSTPSRSSSSNFNSGSSTSTGRSSSSGSSSSSSMSKGGRR